MPRKLENNFINLFFKCIVKLHIDHLYRTLFLSFRISLQSSTDFISEFDTLHNIWYKLKTFTIFY